MTDAYDEDIAQLREIAETFDDGLDTARVGSVGYEEDGGSVVRLFTDEPVELRDAVADAYLGNQDNRTGSKRYTVATTPDEEAYRIETIEDGFNVTATDYGLELRFDEADPDWALDEAAKLGRELDA